MTVNSIIVAFFSGFLVDVFYTWWIKAIGRNAAVTAGICSMLIGACGLLGITAVIHEPWLAPMYLAGVGIGSAGAVWYGANHDCNKQ